MVQTKGKGSVTVMTETGKRILRNVLLVPSLKQNYLSVPHLTDDGYGIMFNISGCTITNKKGEKILEAAMRDDCYCIQFSRMRNKEQQGETSKKKIEIKPEAAGKACKVAEAENLQEKKEKESQSFVIEGVTNLTNDHDVQETWKKKPVIEVEYQRDSTTETKKTEVAKTELIVQGTKSHKWMFEEDTEQKNGNLSEIEKKLVEEAAGREVSKAHEKLEVEVGKVHEIMEANPGKNKDFKDQAELESTKFSEKQDQTEERKMKLPLKPMSKTDGRKRESQDLDSSRSSPHKTVHEKEIQGSVEIKQKQSKSEKEKTIAEPKNKGNKFQNWETGDKEGCTTKQVKQNQKLQNQRERDARNSPLWDEQNFNEEVEKEEIPSLIEWKLNQSEVDKEKRSQEPENKKNKFLNWKKVDKKGSTAKQKQRCQTQREKEVRKLHWWEELHLAKTEIRDMDVAQKHLQKEETQKLVVMEVKLKTTEEKFKCEILQKVHKEESRLMENKRKREIEDKDYTQIHLQGSEPQDSVEIMYNKREIELGIKQRKAKKLPVCAESKSINLDDGDEEPNHVAAERDMGVRELSHVGEEIDVLSLTSGYMPKQNSQVSAKIKQGEEKLELEIKFGKSMMFTEVGVMREKENLPASFADVVRGISSKVKEIAGEEQGGFEIKTSSWNTRIEQKDQEGVLEIDPLLDTGQVASEEEGPCCCPRM